MSDPIFNIHDTLLLATAFQSFLFVLLILIAKYEHHVSDYFLVGIFLAQIAITAHIMINFGEEFKHIALGISPSLFRLFDIAFWLEGPLLLWYTRSLLYKNFSLSSFDFVYITPTIAYLVYISFTFHSLDSAGQIAFLQANEAALAPSVQHGIDAIRESLRVIFCVICLIDIRWAQQQIRERYSNIDSIEFGWLSFLVIAFTIVRVWILLVILVAILAPNLGSAVFDGLGIAGNYLTFALISALMFFSLQRSSLFDGHITEEDSSASEEYTVDPELTARIEQFMDVNKPYLAHLLNLEQLANQLSMHPRALSVTIKNHFNTNFYEFINSYRIEEAKQILADPTQKHKTMIEILGECGFNSKATYNTFFKKLVGVTPTQYKTAMAAGQKKRQPR